MVRTPERFKGGRTGKSLRGNSEQVAEHMPDASFDYYVKQIKDRIDSSPTEKTITGIFKRIAGTDYSEANERKILEHFMPKKAVESEEEDEELQEYIPIKNITCKKLEDLAFKQGFEHKSSSGGHRQYEHPDGRKTTIPFSGAKDAVAYGIAKSILEAIGLK